MPFRAPQNIRFLGSFKSVTALTNPNISLATSVKLVHTFSNNFYLTAFSISSKTGPRFTDENGYFFDF
jgi:hypothetical protein